MRRSLDSSLLQLASSCAATAFVRLARLCFLEPHHARSTVRSGRYGHNRPALVSCPRAATASCWRLLLRLLNETVAAVLLCIAAAGCAAAVRLIREINTLTADQGQSPTSGYTWSLRLSLSLLGLLVPSSSGLLAVRYSSLHLATTEVVHTRPRQFPVAYRVSREFANLET